MTDVILEWPGHGGDAAAALVTLINLRPLSPATTSPWTVGGVFAWVYERAKFTYLRARLSPREAHLVATFDRVSRRIGGPVLVARNAQDLVHALDQAAAEREVQSLALQALQAVTLSSVLTRIGIEPRRRYVHVLGEAPTAKLVAALPLARVSYAELLRRLALMSPDEMSSMYGSVSISDPLAFVYDASIPLAIRRAMLDAVRTMPAMLAIQRALARGETLWPWLAQELTDIVARGQRANLRLLALIPGSAVPEEVLSIKDRLDPVELAAERQRAAARVEALVAETEPGHNSRQSPTN